jgi:L-aspartate oxidase
MGGIWTDADGRTSLPGLYALGECAATGLHGANRLASNSLLEAGVMALKLAQTIGGEKTASLPRGRVSLEHSILLASKYHSAEHIDELRQKMFANVGLIREGRALEETVLACAQASQHEVALEQSEIEAANLGLLGSLICRAAMARCESRGAHWRADFPHKDDANFLGRFFQSRDSFGFRKLGFAPAATPFVMAPLNALGSTF